MAKERIFIHIPKTAGTTLDCAVKGKQWMNNTQDLYYCHISNETKRSNPGDILEKSKRSLEHIQKKLSKRLMNPIKKASFFSRLFSKKQGA